MKQVAYIFELDVFGVVLGVGTVVGATIGKSEVVASAGRNGDDGG